jgi:hypothetical protein
MRIWSWGLRYRALLLCFVVVFLVNCLLTLFRKINSSDYPISKALLNSSSATCGCCSPSQFCRSNLYFCLDVSAGLYRPLGLLKEKLFTLDESLFLTGSCHGDGRTIFDVTPKQRTVRGMTFDCCFYCMERKGPNI